MLRRFFGKIPLAWQQLMKEKTRLAVALAGIAFADILMFAQMGFEGALFDSSIALHKRFNTDLVVVSRNFETIYSIRDFSNDFLYQARGYADVESVSPVYIGLGKWNNLETHSLQTILIVGTDPANPILNFPEFDANRSQLQILNQVLFDQAAFPKIIDLLQMRSLRDVSRSGVEIDINEVTVLIKGLFSLGKSFASSGNIITSDLTFLHLFPSHQPNQIGVGLVKLKPGANIEQAIQTLQTALSPNVRVLTPKGFIDLERNYWSKTTPIGFIFGVGVIVSFMVGSVIVYQILYSDVAAHLCEYAMLKAMGYTNNYLLGVLAQEAMFLAVLGYFPGFILAAGFYNLAANATMLPVIMTLERCVKIFLLTLVMCFISGAIAMRKLRSADPADLL
jgi:putative ABC transport system permease protein